MEFLLALILIQELVNAAGSQTPRDLEQQHIRILEELGTDRAARTQAVHDIMGVQEEIRTAQSAIKPALEEVVQEMRRLNQTLAIANAERSSQLEMVGRVLDMLSDALLPLIVAVFIGSKTPIGKRLLERKK
jgi:hypothetical protein